MRVLALIVAVGLAAVPCAADTLVAARVVRAQAVLGPQDIALIAGDVQGALTDPTAAIGMEARVMIYAGRPIRPSDIRPPALVDRNQIVTLRYRQGGLEIVAEARALGRAAAGEALRVMNLSSRTTVTGRVTENGEVLVGPAMN